jgi:hypothetical protein
VVDIVDLEQVLLPVLLLFLVSINRATLHAHYFSCYRRSIIVAFDSIVNLPTKSYFLYLLS